MTEMSRVELLDWAEPGSHELLGHAFSEEHLQELAQRVSTLRQNFLVQAVKDEIARRNGEADELNETESGVCFSDLPARFVLTRDQHKEIVRTWDHFEPGGHRERDAYGYWVHMAVVEAEIQGFRDFATKNDDFFFTPDNPNSKDLTKSDLVRFEKHAARSKRITDDGYPVKLFMAGNQYIYTAAIDLDTVEDWLKMRDEMTVGIVYWTPMMFWPWMVETKRKYDEDNNLQTYADQVQEVTNGVYVGEYLPPEIVESGEFITIDETYRFARLANEEESLSTRTFRLLVDEAIRDRGVFGKLRSEHFSPPPRSRKSGVVFFHRELLEFLVDGLEDRLGARSKVVKLGSAMLDHFDPEYLDYDIEDIAFTPSGKS